uniref:Uncharacterized protein n=1 Tax=Vespula pensylvanica TaxID=30213 RepID=A0A834K4V8_VESPE|nr:hypothetical protein H0235_015662 [Vespula pensylvanica]
MLYTRPPLFPPPFCFSEEIAEIQKETSSLPTNNRKHDASKKEKEKEEEVSRAYINVSPREKDTPVTGSELTAILRSHLLLPPKGKLLRSLSQLPSNRNCLRASN